MDKPTNKVNMKLKFYNLMYVDLEEKRYLSGKTYNNEERIDLYVKGNEALVNWHKADIKRYGQKFNKI